ncbi:Mariner Mos1 transposase [Eumeta japonica]|uniref:Mariner Mos1 transposase n=1 Tax=Eumeta variegata TaxID=151549 RepID=A0A4C1TSC3_EUMVA|nr:Mariner Mos1 transposase [Eumeta japonica]
MFQCSVLIAKKSAAEAHRVLVEIYGGNAPADKLFREWFRRYKSGDFNVEDNANSGQPKNTCRSANDEVTPSPIPSSASSAAHLSEWEDDLTLQRPSASVRQQRSEPTAWRAVRGTERI